MASLWSGPPTLGEAGGAFMFSNTTLLLNANLLNTTSNPASPDMEHGQPGVLLQRSSAAPERAGRRNPLIAPGPAMCVFRNRNRNDGNPRAFEQQAGTGHVDGRSDQQHPMNASAPGDPRGVGRVVLGRATVFLEHQGGRG